MRLLPAERLIVNVIVALAGIDAALIAFKGVAVDTAGYAGAFAIGAMMITIGQFYRRVRHNEGIALATTAAGLFIVFTLTGSVFNYLLLPIRSGPYDNMLVRFDAALGYSWPALLSWMAKHVWFGELLRFVYISSLPQLLVVIVILGFSRRSAELHRFLLTGVIAGLATICIWSVFPSFGASSVEAVPADARAALPVIVGTEYAAKLIRLGAEGVRYISPKDTLGLVGFPSFHTVMACMSVWFMCASRKAAPLFMALNLIMIPAILVQGGHHLSDMLGGLVVFAVSLQLASLALRQLAARELPLWTTQAAS
jgi:PAP2 superfamily